MSMFPAPVRLVLATALVAVLASACQKSAEERMASAAASAATGQDVEVQRDGDTTTFSTDEGDVTVATGEGLSLPDGFPDDVYLPREYTLRSVLNVAGTQVLSLSTRGDATTLFNEASAEMKAKGWTQTMAMQNDARNAMLAFEKGERNAVVSVNGDDDGEVQVGLQFRERQ
ncbi:hypothetical protein [Marilutibacter aestuarii]|uniref:Lipoprotein n=1 Tax=Marilutibacter aestuarii TaxID=1706195 RepID=A0A507ZYJ3_9GAMM|nr:hypothetical protein [Lysobacter aestuarii]TQD41641.1 hypothetical protein FKV25_12650 [Lysobacter aestuarii]